MGINSWIFLKNGKPAFIQPSPSQNEWLIATAAAQCVEDDDRYILLGYFFNHAIQ
jgi:hypothetical protein